MFSCPCRAVVQKYLLEKSRIVSQGRNERNYHVFYYLLAGANEQERQVLHLRNCEWYNYLNKSGCYGLENIDERHEFSRLKQSMEMVGFTPEKQRRLFAVLSAVLLLGWYFYLLENVQQVFAFYKIFKLSIFSSRQRRIPAKKILSSPRRSCGSKKS